MKNKDLWKQDVEAMSIMNKKIEELYKVIDAKDKIINEQVLKIEDLQQRINKAIEYIKKDTRWFDYEYSKIYGELCTCKGANSNRLEVMVNPRNLLEILRSDNNV